MSDPSRVPTVMRPAPGRIWYAVAVLAVLSGFAGAMFVGYTKLKDVTGGLTQIVVPGGAVLTLQPGHYTIFHEYQSAVDGRIYSGTDISGLLVQVVPTDGLQPLALGRPGVSSTYELGGRAGQSVFAFDVTKAGEYRLAASYPEGREQPQAVLAVGQGTAWRIVSLVLSAIGLALLGVVAGVLIAVMVYRRRRAALPPR